MAYSAAKHQIFSQRSEQWMRTFQTLRDELAKLDELYVNETASGAHADFTDTAIATKQEHIDAINMMRALVDFTEGNAVATLDRVSNITAFVQAE